MTDISPLQCAIWRGSQNVFDYLEKENLINYTLQDHNGNYLLMFALMNNRYKIARNDKYTSAESTEKFQILKSKLPFLRENHKNDN